MDSLAEARPISRQLRFDDAEIRVRKAFLELGEADAALLRELHGRLQSMPNEFADTFYRHLRHFPELRALLGDEAKVVHQCWHAGGLEPDRA